MKFLANHFFSFRIKFQHYFPLWKRHICFVSPGHNSSSHVQLNAPPRGRIVNCRIGMWPRSRVSYVLQKPLLDFVPKTRMNMRIDIYCAAVYGKQ